VKFAFCLCFSGKNLFFEKISSKTYIQVRKHFSVRVDSIERPYARAKCSLPLNQDTFGNPHNIMSISTMNIVVQKRDYYTSKEPVDLFLTTLVVCTRQQ